MEIRHLLTLLPATVLALTAVCPIEEVHAQSIAASSTQDGALGEPTFFGEVLPILQESCQACHRPGEVAPMPLLTYDDARRWAPEIRRMVASRAMPPWSGDSSVGRSFHNDRSLSDEEIATVLAWVDGRMLAGDHALAPPSPEFVEGWQIKPDMILDVPEFDVPATGTVEYTYYILPETFAEDTWIRLAEMRPTNREVTHHLIAYVRPPGSSYFRDYPVGEFFVPEAEARSPEDGESAFRWRELLAGYAPGTNVWESRFPEDQGQLIEAGSQIVFELHYTTNGQATRDRPRVGLVLFGGVPRTRRMVANVRNTEFTIPAHAEAHRVDAAVEITHEATLLDLVPHMHLRGKSWEFRAVFPDGREELLLSVPRYDFNWQTFYFLEEPIRLPPGTVIEATAHFDNSAGNPHNPDPSVSVGWGDQSWEEMMVGFFELEVDVGVDPDSVFRQVETPEGS